MTATNHALTGALIGLCVGNPYIAIPAAILSHFVCDAIPHFTPKVDPVGEKWLRYLLIAEAFLCFVIVLVLFIFKPTHWLLASFCAFAATSPDFMQIPRFVRAQKGLPEAQKISLLLRFHIAIQWFARPIGAVVEAAWAVSAVILLKLFLV